MNLKIVFHKIASRLSTLLWLAIGSLTLISIKNDPSGYPINLIMGSAFILVSYYLILRQRNMFAMLAEIKHLANKIPTLSRRFDQLLSLEITLVILSLFVSSVLLSGAIHRVFIEHKSIFG